MLAKSIIAIAAIGIATGLVGATTGSAQTASVAYCKALAERYERYVGTSSGGQGENQATLWASHAINQCRAGDAATATPILEHALQAAKIALPQRTEAST